LGQAAFFFWFVCICWVFFEMTVKRAGARSLFPFGLLPPDHAFSSLFSVFPSLSFLKCFPVSVPRTPRLSPVVEPFLLRQQRDLGSLSSSFTFPPNGTRQWNFFYPPPPPPPPPPPSPPPPPPPPPPPQQKIPTFL